MSQVTLTFVLTSVAQAAAFAAHAEKFFGADAGTVIGFAGAIGGEEAATASGKPADKKGSKAKPAETQPTASPAPAAPATPATESKPQPAAEPEKAKPVEYKDTGIGELIQQMVQSKGKEPVVALLGKYGAKKGGELKPEQFDAFKAEIEGILNPAAGDDLS